MRDVTRHDAVKKIINGSDVLTVDKTITPPACNHSQHGTRGCEPTQIGRCGAEILL